MFAVPCLFGFFSPTVISLIHQFISLVFCVVYLIVFVIHMLKIIFLQKRRMGKISFKKTTNRPPHPQNPQNKRALQINPLNPKYWLKHRLEILWFCFPGAIPGALLLSVLLSKPYIHPLSFSLLSPKHLVPLFTKRMVRSSPLSLGRGHPFKDAYSCHGMGPSRN